jgi:hypothetical protein
MSEFGQERTFSQPCSKSALPLKADIWSSAIISATDDIRFGHI